MIRSSSLDMRPLGFFLFKPILRVGPVSFQSKKLYMKLEFLMTFIFLFLITGLQTYESEDKATPKISRLEQADKKGTAEAQ